MSAREGRLHAPHKAALVVDEGGGRTGIYSPAPGLFCPAVRDGDLVDARGRGAAAGTCIGELEILGKSYRVLLGRGAGKVELCAKLAGRARVAVSAGELLLALDGSVALGGAEPSAGPSATGAAGLVLRAPSSGRFYLRPGPQKPPFVAVGSIVERGHTMCLLEVMKTFHRVTYDDPSLPERAKIVAVLAQEEADVTAGAPLFAVEAA